MKGTFVRRATAFVCLLFCLRYLTVGSPVPFDDSTKESGRAAVVVRTSLGDIAGKREGQVNVFLGIPFAEPPTGTFRFRPPRPKRPWAPSTYQAHSYSPECLQSSLYTSSDGAEREDGIVRDEDCLYLNVWVPANHNFNEKGLLPVMFWVYGGAFMHGSASKPEYVGDQLAARGVILVSCNYRMGALGFLVSTTDGLFGNYGLADQKLAMMWVQEHVRNFGGDPTRVTLFGESAGAMSIGLHFLDQHYQQQRLQRGNPRRPRKWLFHAIVLQSNPLGYKYRAVTVANFLGAAYKDRLDCEDLRCLQSESADELMHVQDTLMAVPRNIGDFFSWGPVTTDQNYWREYRLRPGPESNITVRQPLEALRDLMRLGKKLDVPVLIGTTKDEGRVFVFSAFHTHMPKVVYQALVVSFFRESAFKVLKQYTALSERESESPYPDFRTVLSTIIGDYLFRCPNQLFASLLTATNTSVFLYEFSLPTRTPGFPCCDGLACHTAELPYVFNQLKVIEEEYSWNAPPGLEVDELDFIGEGRSGSSGSSIRSSSGSSSGSGSSSSGRFSFPIPDIFGAATSWFGHSSASTSGNAGGAQNKPRAQIDSNVSSTMADYWTTFATYGDPNGLPSPPNGYLGSTRPSEGPWWPTLLGALNREVGGEFVAWDSMGSSDDKEDVEDVEDEGRTGTGTNNLIKRNRERRRSELLRGDHEEESDFGYEDEASAIDFGDELVSEETIAIDGTPEPAVRARRMYRSNKMSKNGNDVSRDGATHSTPSSFSGSRPIDAKKSAFDAMTRRRSVEQTAMHILKLDEITEVMLLEKDCTCAMWHRLLYKF